MKYKIEVPPTMEQGGYTAIVTVTSGETKSQAALHSYNSARAHDGLPPLERMPRGTVYSRLYEWDIQQYTGTWETVCTEETHKEARERAKEYRENQPEYPVRIKLVYL